MEISVYAVVAVILCALLAGMVSRRVETADEALHQFLEMPIRVFRQKHRD